MDAFEETLKRKLSREVIAFAGHGLVSGSLSIELATRR
jgi:hypothetical protein